jgi:hypothetical protein
MLTPILATQAPNPRRPPTAEQPRPSMLDEIPSTNITHNSRNDKRPYTLKTTAQHEFKPRSGPHQPQILQSTVFDKPTIGRTSVIPPFLEAS